MKLCAVYGRVSTDMQGDSLDNQVDYAKEYIRRLGDEFVFDESLTYTDFDQSGYYTRFIDRPAIQRALVDAKEHKYQVIVFKEISRISRDQAEHVEIVSRFMQYGVRVIAINDNLDSDRPETLDLLGIHSVMAEMESKRISSRVSAGKRSLARRGLWVGEPPIGYRLNPDSKKLEIDDDYAVIPQTIFKLFTEERLGCFKIAEHLNTRGLLSKNGKLWSRVTVNRVLRNPAYVGDLVYGKTRNKLKRDFENGYKKIKARTPVAEDDWVVVSNTHPALVRRDVFESAQSIISGRSKQNPRRSSHPLTGILKCGHCGAGMICQRAVYGETVYRYYYCSSAFRFGKDVCGQPSINADVIERSIWTWLVQHLAAYDKSSVSARIKQASKDTQQELQRLERELKRSRVALDRLLTDIEISGETFNELKVKYLEQIKACESEIALLKDRMREDDSKQHFDANVRHFLAVLAKLDLGDLQRSRQVFHELIEKVIVKDKAVEEVILKYMS